MTANNKQIPFKRGYWFLTPKQRFENNVMPIPESGCWVWMGSVGSGGYGMFCVNYKHYLAHRFSWELYKGDIPKGLCICHKCDVRCCVNPDHLFLGSNKDNTQDALRKGRMAFGTRNKSAKLNIAMVKEIRNKYESGDISQTALANLYGVRQSTMWAILTRRSWANV